MENNPVLPVINGLTKRGINRREMVQRLFGGAGAALAIPGVASGHPIHQHLANSAVLEAADAQAAAAEWSPAFLDPHQNETLIVLAELIVPGSTKAQVNRFIDLLLSVDSEESRKNFVEELSAFEAEALKRHRQPFKDLTAEQQNQILTEASTAGSFHREGRAFRRGPAMPGETAAATPEQSMRGHFENLKAWVSGAYYSSEIGMRELGWTGNYFYETFPGCPHPDEHH